MTKLPTFTVKELMKAGVAPFQLPTLEPDAQIEVVSHPDYDYWYRWTNPLTGDTDEVRGRSYWRKEQLVGRAGNSETWIS